MKREYFFYIYILLFFLSCSLNEQKNKNSQSDNIRRDVSDLESVIDTLTTFNSLFTIKKIPLKIEGKMIGNVTYYIGDKYGNIYVLDNKNIIYKFDINGKYINELNSIGKGPGEYSSINLFAVDDAQRIYCDDFLQNEIEVYDKEFKHLFSIRKRSPTSVVDIEFDKKGNLYLFDSFSKTNSITIYNTRSGKLIGEFGNGDKLVRKYNTRIKSGNIIIDGNNIFYCLPNYYQLYELSNKGDKELLKEVPSHFEQISKPIKNPRHDPYGASRINYIIKQDSFFFVCSTTNFKKNVSSRNNNLVDIYSDEGKLIKEGIILKDINHFVYKYDEKKYISFGYEGELEKNYNLDPVPYFLIFTYKY